LPNRAPATTNTRTREGLDGQPHLGHQITVSRRNQNIPDQGPDDFSRQPPVYRGERVIGWDNLGVVARRLQAQFGYVTGRAPRERRYSLTLEEELEDLRRCLGLA
jgi:hypothetical protein